MIQKAVAAWLRASPNRRRRGIETFAFTAVEPFWRVGPPGFRLVDAPRGDVFFIFISESDPPASGGPPVLVWTILLFLGTD